MKLLSDAVIRQPISSDVRESLRSTGNRYMKKGLYISIMDSWFPVFVRINYSFKQSEIDRGE